MYFLHDKKQLFISSVKQDIFRIYGTQKSIMVYTLSPNVCLSWASCIQSTSPNYIFNNQFNIILPFTLSCSQQLFCFPTKAFFFHLSSPCTYYMPSLPYLLLFNRPDVIWSRNHEDPHYASRLYWYAGGGQKCHHSLRHGFVTTANVIKWDIVTVSRRLLKTKVAYGTRHFPVVTSFVKRRYWLLP